MPLRLNRKGLVELIESIEAGGGDASVLRRELQALGLERRTVRNPRFEEEELTTAERLNNRVGGLFPGGISDDLMARLIDMDRNYSLKELRAMCVEAGLSPSGDKKELAAKLIANEAPVVKLPQAIAPRGTCYEDAWRFLFKEEEGELIHGTVLSEGRRTGHAWVELPSGYIWEPETGQYYTPRAFTIAASPEEEDRYTITEAAIMAARTQNLGPWTKEEKHLFIKREGGKFNV